MTAAADTVRVPGDTPWAIGIGIAFVLVNLALILAADPNAAYLHGADAESWLRPALGLLEHGYFVAPDDPGTLETFRQPLYPAFLALFYWIGGGGFVPLVVAQAALLFATGWLARSLTAELLPRWADLALALVVFNPSALGTAHLVQSDTLYAFLITAAFWAAIRYGLAPGWRVAALAGLLFGLSLLTRATGVYLLYVLPVALLLLGALAEGWGGWRRHLGHGVAATAIALAVALPWMAHNAAAGEGFQLSTARLRAAFLWDNLVYLEMYHADRPLAAAEDWGAERRADVLDALPEGTGVLARDQALVDDASWRYLGYPASAWAEAYGWAWAQFFAIPGVSNLLNILELNERTPFAVFQAGDADSYLDAGLRALAQAAPMATVLTVAGFAYVLALRGLGLAGLVVLVRRRHWAVLLTIVAVVAYFALVHLFVANSRYRLPIDPALILLALYGLDGLWRPRLRSAPRHSAQAPPEAS